MLPATGIQKGVQIALANSVIASAEPYVGQLALAAIVPHGVTPHAELGGDFSSMQESVFGVVFHRFGGDFITFCNSWQENNGHCV